MLSRDDINNGRVFILRLWDKAGVSTQWVETLAGDVARRWYDIYRRSDWVALRGEAAGTFQNGVSERELVRVIGQNRCVVIQPTSVRSGELAAAMPLERKAERP